jgi:hypothetical protein
VDDIRVSALDAAILRKARYQGSRLSVGSGTFIPFFISFILNSKCRFDAKIINNFNEKA